MRKSFYSEYFQLEDKHWWFVGRRKILLAVIDRFIPAPMGSERRILDVGCGTGTMLHYLGRYGKAVGIDADESAIGFCKMRGVENVYHVSGLSFPFANETFDLITMFDVLEHIVDDAGAVREVDRVLKPGGMFVMAVPAFRFLWGAQDEISHHKRRYVAGELKRLAEATGMRVRKITYFNTLLFPAIAGIRVLRRAYGEKETKLQSDFTMTKPGIGNTLLAQVFSIERLLINKVRLPFGVSILAVAQKRV